MKVSFFLTPETMKLLVAASHVAGKKTRSLPMEIEFRHFSDSNTQISCEFTVGQWVSRFEIDNHPDCPRCYLYYRPATDAEKYPWVNKDIYEDPKVLKTEAKALAEFLLSNPPKPSSNPGIVISPQGAPVLRN